ncbi:MAG: hypothetical protein DWI00_08075 [Planctomycetota bacterium]|nr:MAG: hypothetical protein DWI00_08075 [Planctomycetota bacterium]
MRHSQRVIHEEPGKHDERDVCLATLSYLKSRSSETQTSSVQLWKTPRPRADLDRGVGIDPSGFDSPVLSRDGRLLAIAKTDSTIWIQETATAQEISVRRYRSKAASGEWRSTRMAAS